MSVLFVPDYSGGNPYQSNLAAALDTEVTCGREGARLPVLAAIRSGEVSVVHVHWLNAFLAGETRRETAVGVTLLVVRLLAARLRGLPVVWTVHNVRLHERQHPRLEYWFKRAFVRTGTCDRLIVHCEAAGDALIDELDLPPSTRDHIDVIPHGHYLDSYANDCTRTEAREALDLPPSATVFLFFGLIRRYKGVLDLLDAFSAAALDDARLVVAGKPETEQLRRELRARTRADDRIQGTFEFVPDDEIQLYMNAADAVALPFRRVTTSGSAILAMSFGRALVVPPVGCLPAVLEDDGAVFYERERDGSLRDALETAAGRDLAAMGEHNRDRVRQFDWATIAERTMETYANAGWKGLERDTSTETEAGTETGTEAGTETGTEAGTETGTETDEQTGTDGTATRQ